MDTVLFVNATIGFSENLFLVIVALLQNATIEYSLESFYASVCVCVCMCVFLRVCFLHDNLKRNQSRNMKFKYVVVNECNLDKFDIGHCRI